MRRKIQDIICGKFETTDAGIEFGARSLQITVLEGGSRKGSFSFRSSGDTAVRGLISCTDPRMEIKNPAFDALRVTASVEYHAEDLIEHDTMRGRLVLLTNVGEYFFPYEIQVTKDYAQTSIGKIRNMTDFTNLARLNWQEALALFRTSRFTQIFHAGEEKEHMLYNALVSRGAGSAQMEEFLVACGRKARNHFIVSDRKKRYVTGMLPLNDRLRIEKTEWGYLQYKVSAQGDFIELSGDGDADAWIRSRKTEIPYRIVPAKMHAGMNYGRIVVEDILERVEIEITAVSEEFHEQRVIFHPERRLRLALQQCFLNYFMGRVKKPDWTAQCLAVLEQFDRIESLRAEAVLLRAYISHENGEEQTFAAHMDTFQEKYVARQKKMPVYALYAYLTTFMNTDAHYVRSVTACVRELNRMYADHPLPVWVLLRMDEVLLRNDERAYQFIRAYMSPEEAAADGRPSDGGNPEKGNPFFYLEAYFLLKENPRLAASGTPGLFEQRLLRWIAKNGLLTEQIMIPVWEKLRLTRDFSEWCFEMLTAAYRANPSAEILKEICMYLIRTGSSGPDFFRWYQEGVKRGLRVAGLYEACIRSFDAERDTLPPEIIKYFILSNDATVKWKASIYAYLIGHQKEAGDDWQKLRPVICDFAKEMMERGEIDPDLYVIYRFLYKEVGTGEWAACAKGMQGSKVVRLDVPKFRHVYAYLADKQMTVNVPIHKGQAFVRTGGSPAVLLLQDDRGCLYTTGGFAGVSDLFATERGAAGDGAAAPAQAAAAKRPDKAAVLQKRLETFAGSLDELDALIAEAKEHEIYCLLQEEKLLTYMLFADHLTAGHAEIFADICNTKENERLCDAYVSVLCRAYICDDLKLHDRARSYLLQAIAAGRNLNAFCRTAVLKMHFKTPASHILTDANADRLLLHLLNDGKCFSFFNDLPERTKRKFLLEGLLFVQCSAAPRRKLYMAANLCLPADADSLKEPEFSGQMQESLPGVYCFMLPVLPGSTVRFRVTDDYGNTRMLYEQMIPAASYDAHAADRYRMLAALFSGKERDEQKAAAYAAQLAWIDKMTKEAKPAAVQLFEEEKSKEQKAQKEQERDEKQEEPREKLLKEKQEEPREEKPKVIRDEKQDSED